MAVAEPPGSRRLLLPTALASVALAAVLLLVFAAIGAGHGRESAVPPELVEDLRDGGQVLLFRHALTDRSQTDAGGGVRGPCDQQRRLSPEGVAQAERIGRAIRDLALPVGDVLTSPYCRAVDTAQAMGLGEVSEVDALESLTVAPDPQARSTTASLMIDEVLGGDEVTVMVTHTQNILALTGEQVEEGSAVVLERRDGQVEVRAVVAADDW